MSKTTYWLCRDCKVIHQPEVMDRVMAALTNQAKCPSCQHQGVDVIQFDTELYLEQPNKCPNCKAIDGWAIRTLEPHDSLVFANCSCSLCGFEVDETYQLTDAYPVIKEK